MVNRPGRIFLPRESLPGRTPPRAREFASLKEEPWNFAEWFAIGQTFIPALLFLPGTQSIRTPLRIMTYGIALVPLLTWFFQSRQRRGGAPLHPAAPIILAACSYMTLTLVSPTTNTLTAGLAQLALYLAVLAPLLWAPSYISTPTRLQRILWILLVCNGVNAFVGVMQVRDPGRWMPSEFSSIYAQSTFGLATVTYTGADGRVIIRPPGLGDAPGAVSTPASFALFLGLVFLATSKSWWRRGVAVFAAGAGATALFLTLVRSNFLIAIGMIAIYGACQVRNRQLVQPLIFVGLAVALFAGAFIYSASVGGDNLVSRFASVLDSDPFDFYYENRGNQVANGFSMLLPEYPLGAGLGRWGMMYSYFGDFSNADSLPIWVEVQWPAWIVDGGLVLLLLYPLALIIVLKTTARASSSKALTPQVRLLAAIVLASSAGVVAKCFSYTVFTSPIGIQFWFLVGGLHGVLSSRAYPMQLAART